MKKVIWELCYFGKTDSWNEKYFVLDIKLKTSHQRSDLRKFALAMRKVDVRNQGDMKISFQISRLENSSSYCYFAIRFKGKILKRYHLSWIFLLLILMQKILLFNSNTTFLRCKDILGGAGQYKKISNHVPPSCSLFFWYTIALYISLFNFSWNRAIFSNLPFH